MRFNHSVLPIMLAGILILQSVILVSNWDPLSAADADDIPMTRDPVEAGTIIKVKGGSEKYNASNYFPVPKDSTLQALNISISPIPYIENGNSYPYNMWFNISGKKMYEYPSSDTAGNHYGLWGRQNVSMGGRDTGIMMDSSHAIPPNFDILLPKNATVTEAVFNITGHQRDLNDMWRNYYYEGNTGDSTGFSLAYIDDTDANNLPEIISGSPTGNNNFGFVSKYEYDPNSNSLLVKGTNVAGIDQYSLFGSSLSESFNYPGQGSMVGIGAPKATSLMKGTVTLVNVASMARYDTLEGNDSMESFGTSVEAGDIDNDGEAEIIVGSPDANSGEGRIYILDLDNSGDFSSGTSLKAVIEGPSGETGFGRNISIGDVDGDMVMDIAVSTEEKIRIYTGGNSMDFDSDYTIDPIVSGGVISFGHVEFIGDVSGYGEETLAVGCPGGISGAVLLYDSPSGGTLILDSKYTPSGSMISNNFGFKISDVCDYDMDGNLEFAISSVGGASSRGSIGIYQFDSTDPEKVLTEPSTGSMYGHDVLFCADMVNNGYVDVVAGATYYAGAASVSNGRIYIEEFFDSSTLGENPPTVKLNGADAWTYSEDHLTDTVQTSDLKNLINSIIESSDIVDGISTTYNEYVRINLAITSPDIPNLEKSRLFSVDGIKIMYDQTVVFPDLSGMIQGYIANPNVKPQSDGNYHIPFMLKSDSAGGLRINTIIQDFDYPPVIENPIQYLSLKEDTHNRYLLDLWHVFGDDKTEDKNLSFVVVNEGVNHSYVSASIWNDRYLSIDAFNDTDDSHSNDNWTGEVKLIIVVRDSLDAISALEDLVVEVIPVNDPPMLGNDPRAHVFQDGLFEFIPEVNDAEGDEFDISLIGPGNMSLIGGININWYPNNWDVGNHTWTLTMTDGKDETRYDFDLDVENVNDNPYFMTYPPKYSTVYVGDTYTFDFDGKDIDPTDSLKYEIIKGLQGSLIDETTGVFTWTPLIFQFDPIEYIVRISDNTRNFTEYTFYINLSLKLLEPEITSEPDRILYDMMVWNYDIEIFDPNDDIPLISFIDGPPGMELSEITNILSWRPLSNQTGTHTVILKIVSSGYTLDHIFNLTVQRAIRIWDLTVSQGLEGKKISGKFLFTGSLNLTPSDVEYVQIRIDDEPWINATYIEETWSHEIDTNDYGNGKHTLSVRAYDGYEWSQTETIEVNISNSSGFPIWLLFLIILIVIILILIAIVGAIITIQKRMKQSEDDRIHKLTKDDFDQSRAELDRFLDDVGKEVPDDTSIYEDEVAPMDLGDLIHDQGVVESCVDTKIFDKQSREVYELGGMECVDEKPILEETDSDDDIEPIEEMEEQQEPPGSIEEE